MYWECIYAAVRIAACAAFCYLSVCYANAATISVKLSGGIEVPTITVDGKIDFDDDKKFKSIATALSTALVVFNSDGGSAFAGLEIGRLIRSRNFSTHVIERCVSACALAWLGGTKRFMVPAAQIGFHAVYNADTGRETAAANALVGAYLNQMGLADAAVIYITQAVPTSMTWLNPGSAQRVGIELSVLDTQDVKPGPSAGKDVRPKKAPDLKNAALVPTRS